MANDIVPELLDQIKKEFNQEYKANIKIKALLKKLETEKLDYDDAYNYAEEVGKILVKTLKNNINPETLPEGKMHYNIAKRIMDDTLINNHELVADYSQIVQTAINNQAGYNIKGLKSELNYDRIDGFIQRLASEENFEDIDWILGDPVMTFTRVTVDNTVEINAEYNHKLGIEAVIERTERYDACPWCKSLEGVYNYPDDVPDEVYMRHDNCRGRVIYKPADKWKVQNVHDKEWYWR